MERFKYAAGHVIINVCIDSRSAMIWQSVQRHPIGIRPQVDIWRALKMLTVGVFYDSAARHSKGRLTELSRLHYASSIWHWKCRNRRRKCNRRIRRSALFDRCLPNTTIHQQRVLSLFASEERRSVTWPAVKLTSAILLIFWIHNPVSAEGGGNSHPSIFHTFFWNLITVDIFKRF